MAWSTITSPNTSTANRFGGDVMQKINNMFNGVDISDTVTINSNVVWTWPADAFDLVDTADASKQVLFNLGGITTSNQRTVSFPDLDITLGPSTLGLHDIFIRPSDMYATATAGFVTSLTTRELATNDQNIQYIGFTDTGGTQHAQFAWSPPRNWDNGNVTLVFYWTAAAGSAAETVEFETKARAFSNDDPLDVSWGSTVAVTDALIATDDVHISPRSADITIGGTPADADFILFDIARDSATDNLAAEAQLIGVSIEYTISDGTAA